MMPSDFQGRLGLLSTVLCLLIGMISIGAGELVLLLPTIAFLLCACACYDQRREAQRLRDRDLLLDFQARQGEKHTPDLTP